MPYAPESFSPNERAVLSHYVTNLDGPVFALVNLPEVVKGALFARYSRSAKSLRRLFLDEFVGDLDISGDETVDATVGLRRAEELYERVFGEYGDDSVAQLGGVHVACEQVSNIATKVLERGRLMSYLEQSTRYVPYDSRLPSGHYRYYRSPEILESPLGARYVGEMDRMFDTYGEVMRGLLEHLRKNLARPDGVPDVAWRQSVRARALDSSRGLLPAASLSNVGIYGSGQSFELLIMKMRAHLVPEVRRLAEEMLLEVRKVIPSFLTRIDRPDRGGEWTEYFRRGEESARELAAELFASDAADHSGAPTIELSWFDPNGEDRVLEAIAYGIVPASDASIAERVKRLGPDERRALLATYVGERTNRRHRPGRAFEATDYRFDIVADYGAFRDLQRHRMLTVEWQPLTTSLGASVPPDVVDAGLDKTFCAALDRSRDLYEALLERFPDEAPYAVALAFNIRFSMQMNAREAMHLIELRSGPQGHPSYRSIAQAMHTLIRDKAGHRAIADSMRFVDYSDTGLGRLEAETRAEARKQGAAPGQM